MSKSNEFEEQFLDLAFLNSPIAGLGDASGILGSAVAGNYTLALHTADPGEAGSAQTTFEVSYTGYAQVNVPRTAAGFTRTGSTVSLTSARSFPERTDAGATVTATYATLGYNGTIAWRFEITSPSGGIPITQNSTPTIGTDLAVTED